MRTMAADTTEWTVELVRALPDDGKRYEVLDGELFVTPAPGSPHQRAVGSCTSFSARTHAPTPWERRGLPPRT